MKLPFAENAVIDDAKLISYCLSPDHPRGKHKARLFNLLLGLEIADAFRLRNVLLDIAKSHEATPGKRNEFGQYYEIRFEMPGKTGRMVNMLSIWIIRNGEEFHRLVTVYPL